MVNTGTLDDFFSRYYFNVELNETNSMRLISAKDEKTWGKPELVYELGCRIANDLQQRQRDHEAKYQNITIENIPSLNYEQRVVVSPSFEVPSQLLLDAYSKVKDEYPSGYLPILHSAVKAYNSQRLDTKIKELSSMKDVKLNITGLSVFSLYFYSCLLSAMDYNVDELLMQPSSFDRRRKTVFSKLRLLNS